MSPERPSYLLLLPLYLDCGHRGTVKEPVCELPVESNWKEEGSFFLGCSSSKEQIMASWCPKICSLIFTAGIISWCALFCSDCHNKMP